MAPEDCEKHLLAGLDDRQRGFSRQVDIESREGQYRASFRYEKLFLAAELQATNEAALVSLVQSLQTRGYRQLRSKLSFRGKDYCTGIEAWTEYADPPEPEKRRRSLMGMLLVLWKRCVP
jgi:hypothetical protein